MPIRFALNCLVALAMALIVILPNNSHTRAEDKKQIEQTDALQPFNSVEGGFSIKLPSKPQLSKETFPDSDDVQYQLIAGDSDGIFLISWQESPKLAASPEEKQMQALKVSREGIEKRFSSELLTENKVPFREKVNALRFKLQLPEKRGQLHGIFFFANSRFYQIMVIGTDQFVSSRQARDVVDSFQLTGRQ